MQDLEKMLQQTEQWEVAQSPLLIIFSLRSVYGLSYSPLLIIKCDIPYLLMICSFMCDLFLIRFSFFGHSSDSFLWDRQYTCNEGEFCSAQGLLRHLWHCFIRWNVFILGQFFNFFKDLTALTLPYHLQFRTIYFNF